MVKVLFLSFVFGLAAWLMAVIRIIIFSALRYQNSTYCR